MQRVTEWKSGACTRWHDNLIEVVACLHALTLTVSREPDWDKVRDAVTCLDSIADVMRRALAV